MFASFPPFRKSLKNHPSDCQIHLSPVLISVPRISAIPLNMSAVLIPFLRMSTIKMTPFMSILHKVIEAQTTGALLCASLTFFQVASDVLVENDEQGITG